MFKLIATAAVAAGISWIASNELHKRQRARLMEFMAEDRAEAAEKTFNAAFKAGEKSAMEELQENFQRELKELHDSYEYRMEETKTNAFSEGYEKGKKARLQAAASYKKGYEDGKKDAVESKEEGRLKAV